MCDEIRTKFVKRISISISSSQKSTRLVFINLLTSQDKKINTNVAKSIKNCFEKKRDVEGVNLAFFKLVNSSDDFQRNLRVYPQVRTMSSHHAQFDGFIFCLIYGHCATYPVVSLTLLPTVLSSLVGPKLHWNLITNLLSPNVFLFVFVNVHFYLNNIIVLCVYGMGESLKFNF